MRFSGRISGKSCSSFMCPSLYTPMFERVDLMLLARQRPPSQMLVSILLHSGVSSQPKQHTVGQLFTNSNGDLHHTSASSVSSSRSHTRLLSCDFAISATPTEPELAALNIARPSNAIAHVSALIRYGACWFHNKQQ